MASCREFSTPGIIAFCDDIRVRAPKQTALAVRYFLEIAADPRKPASNYHQAIMGEQNYSHGNTIIRGLASLHYLQITRSRQQGSGDLIELAPTWKKRLAPARNYSNNTRDGTSMDIQLVVDDTERQVCLTSPYHPDMPPLAREANGTWNGETWVFPLEAEAEVRRICLEVYGEDGAPQSRVTLRCRASESLVGKTPAKSIFLAGRKVASPKGADSGVLLGDSIKVLRGGFDRKEGTKGPEVFVKGGTVFEIRDVPKLAADRLLDQHPEDVVAISESAPVPASEQGAAIAPKPQRHQPPSQTPQGGAAAYLVPMLRESLQEAREDIMRICEAHDLPWPEEELAKYQRAIDKARVSELTSRSR